MNPNDRTETRLPANRTVVVHDPDPSRLEQVVSFVRSLGCEPIAAPERSNVVDAVFADVPPALILCGGGHGPKQWFDVDVIVKSWSTRNFHDYSAGPSGGFGPALKRRLRDIIEEKVFGVSCAPRRDYFSRERSALTEQLVDHRGLEPEDLPTGELGRRIHIGRLRAMAFLLARETENIVAQRMASEAQVLSETMSCLPIPRDWDDRDPRKMALLERLYDRTAELSAEAEELLNDLHADE